MGGVRDYVKGNRTKNNSLGEKEEMGTDGNLYKMQFTRNSQNWR